MTEVCSSSSTDTSQGDRSKKKHQKTKKQLASNIVPVPKLNYFREQSVHIIASIKNIIQWTLSKVKNESFDQDWLTRLIPTVWPSNFVEVNSLPNNFTKSGVFTFLVILHNITWCGTGKIIEIKISGS